MISIQHPDLPTFYLHPNVQGITTESHAKKVAAKITRKPPHEHNVLFLDRDED